jgi:hypothetical protein
MSILNILKLSAAFNSISFFFLGANLWKTNDTLEQTSKATSMALSEIAKQKADVIVEQVVSNSPVLNSLLNSLPVLSTGFSSVLGVGALGLAAQGLLFFYNKRLERLQEISQLGAMTRNVSVFSTKLDSTADQQTGLKAALDLIVGDLNVVSSSVSELITFTRTLANDTTSFKEALVILQTQSNSFSDSLSNAHSSLQRVQDGLRQTSISQNEQNNLLRSLVDPGFQQAEAVPRQIDLGPPTPSSINPSSTTPPPPR